MNGFQIYEISKQAHFESNYDIELYRGWDEDRLNTPHRSFIARLSATLRQGLAVLRIVRAEPSRN